MDIHMDQAAHLPVLYQDIINALNPRSGGRYVDCTLGAGGHSWGILEKSSPRGQLLGLEIDPSAMELARSHLSVYGERVILVRASYTELILQLAKLGWESVDGMLFDLGLSSMQLDTGSRGFSFTYDAPLDMRFDRENPITAGKLVNDLSEDELGSLIYNFGEERYARQIAHSIINSRPILTTGQLAKLVVEIYKRKRTVGKRTKEANESIHPATRTFQALRIAVNKELESIEAVLPDAINALTTGGRLAVISFHSLEDRIVKHVFRQESRDCICPPNIPICICGHRATIREITRKPIRPTIEEIEKNPRARSARLRIAEKI
jgi:16S rRNA (cytosine1402-N4)-methyltransferase